MSGSQPSVPSHEDSTDAGSGPGLQSFAVALRRLNGEFTRLVHDFAHAQGLHGTDAAALAAILDADPPMTPGRLREHLGLTSGAVTACLDRLERAGHVRRCRDAADRRVVHLYYEENARAAARAHFGPLARATDRARAQLSEDEQRAALRFLTLLSSELQALPVHNP
ncbi:MarR family winged helix-turn-helix transcriptional regulator [Streptomyces tubbatahanensis]|uniref:MarR family winged helix-turn-helix transcriptional regulator n=1 Tax=Streptomyces tubbatahanensis TaxID=2923272 RepID=A0ABY3XL88_9ACTN|nr:MarR family winged helix-turn-helix transcriptional regulator [Streptomyces tubbatahanensis]UNS95182.1 MarR family winged helix-turn-helix transcriptional regulator [Streptomyces tubbatahanensis]